MPRPPRRQLGRYTAAGGAVDDALFRGYRARADGVEEIGRAFAGGGDVVNDIEGVSRRRQQIVYRDFVGGPCGHGCEQQHRENTDLSGQQTLQSPILGRTYRTSGDGMRSMHAGIERAADPRLVGEYI